MVDLIINKNVSSMKKTKQTVLHFEKNTKSNSLIDWKWAGQIKARKILRTFKKKGSYRACHMPSTAIINKVYERGMDRIRLGPWVVLTGVTDIFSKVYNNP